MAMLHVVAPLIGFAEQGKLPDWMVRKGIQSLLKTRLKTLEGTSLEAAADSFRHFLRELAAGQMACLPEKANEQHYEVPAAFFGEVLRLGIAQPVDSRALSKGIDSGDFEFEFAA